MIIKKIKFADISSFETKYYINQKKRVSESFELPWDVLPKQYRKNNFFGVFKEGILEIHQINTTKSSMDFFLSSSKS